MILPQTSREAAMVFAERVRRVVEAIPDPHRAITASIGVATIQPDTALPASLIGDADGAMYQAKRAGRNTVCHANSSVFKPV